MDRKFKNYNTSVRLLLIGKIKMLKETPGHKHGANGRNPKQTKNIED